MPRLTCISLLCTWLFAAETPAQQLSRFFDSHPTGNGNAHMTHHGPTRSWFVGANSLWTTDGTTRGTRRVLTLKSNRGTVHRTIGDRDYFVAWGEQGVLVTTPTGSPSRLAGHLDSVDELSDVHGRLMFLGMQNLGGFPIPRFKYSWWITDGTARGTQELTFLYPNVSDPWGPWPHRGDLYVAGARGAFLRTDGTKAGTVQLVSSPYNAPVPRAYSAGPLLYFVLREKDGEMLWVTDGTKAGTRRLFGSRAHYARRFGGAIGSRFYFSTSHGELWSTDGTVSGTSRSFALPFSVWAVAPPVAVRGGLFTHGRTVSGWQAAFTDGTKAGTTTLGLDLGRGTTAEFCEFTPLGGRHVLIHAKVKGKLGLWLSDGTPSGTRMLVDLSATLQGSFGGAFVRGRFLFAGTDRTGDREIWTVDGIPVSRRVGRGTPRRAEPALNGTMPRLGQTFTLNLTAARRSSRGIALLGSAPSSPIVLGATDLYVDVAKPTIAFGLRTNARGTWQLRATIPNVPTLLSVTIAAQVAVGPTTTSPLNADVSNAVWISPRR